MRITIPGNLCEEELSDYKLPKRLQDLVIHLWLNFFFSLTRLLAINNYQRNFFVDFWKGPKYNSKYLHFFLIFLEQNFHFFENLSHQIFLEMVQFIVQTYLQPINPKAVKTETNQLTFWWKLWYFMVWSIIGFFYPSQSSI